MMRALFILVLLLTQGPVYAGTKYKVVTKESTIAFSVPYTFGNHEGKSASIDGSMEIDSAMNIIAAKIEVPIASLGTGNKKRDCHMREALGLDYSKSKFPKDHVCNGENQIPDQGPDSIAFPNITFEVEGSNRLTLGKNSVRGKWTLHGMSKTAYVDITVSRSKEDEKRYVIEGSQIFVLADFNIKVKPFSLVKVKDTALASFAVVLAP